MPNTWGGVRANSGRKRKSLLPNVEHRVRPVHRESFPMHVTMRRVRELPSLRNHKTHLAVRSSIQRAQRASFRILHYSVQRNHVHLIIEATDRVSVSRGIQGFAIRSAKAVNKTVSHRGSVWADRYHARELKTPREVRNAIAYVLLNFKKHGHYSDGVLDRCSSGFWFDGWRVAIRISEERPPVAKGRTWLATVGWRRCGLLC
jgi:REP element-mobilizing transposase RayT